MVAICTFDIWYNHGYHLIDFGATTLIFDATMERHGGQCRGGWILLHIVMWRVMCTVALKYTLSRFEVVGDSTDLSSVQQLRPAQLNSAQMNSAQLS